MSQVHGLRSAEKARPAALIDAFERLGSRVSFPRDVEIYAQDEPAVQFFRVVRGVVRTSRLTADGRRQVGDFYYPGDVFGLEVAARHRFAAEALTDTDVQVVRRNALRAFAGDAEVDQAVLEATQLELERLQEHVVLLGRKSARERVGAFLMAVAQRQAEEDVVLPMGRQDMADYLGLTIETVSRILTQLRGEAIVDFPSSRLFQVRKWTALEAMAA